MHLAELMPTAVKLSYSSDSRHLRRRRQGQWQDSDLLSDMDSLLNGLRRAGGPHQDAKERCRKSGHQNDRHLNDVLTPLSCRPGFPCRVKAGGPR